MTTAENQRLLSLDAFRGLTIALMILVNNPGSWGAVYGPFKHATWHGATLTDLVFPFFLFIVGISIVISLSKVLTTGGDSSAIRRKIFIRALKIFALGVLLGLLPYFDFSTIRWPGVLQRIAVVYLVCALLFMQQDRKLETIAAFVLLMGYWFAMVFIEVPGLGAGNLEPGFNLANWIDSEYLPGRMWRGTWDPEGLLSTLPAIASGISGMLVGRYLIGDAPRREQVKWLFWAGSSAILTGALWGLFFPLNKSLWTSSYVVYTSGWAIVTLALLIYFMDIKRVIKPFNGLIVFGSNSITIYALSTVLMFALTHGFGIKPAVFGWLVELGVAAKSASLIWAIFFTALCFIPAFILHTKKIFIKL